MLTLRNLDPSSVDVSFTGRQVKHPNARAWVQLRLPEGIAACKVAFKPADQQLEVRPCHRLYEQELLLTFLGTTAKQLFIAIFDGSEIVVLLKFQVMAITL